MRAGVTKYQFLHQTVTTNGRRSMNMGLNWVEVSPHGLIFDEDEATGCPMPLEPFPTPFRLVLGPFKAIFRSKGFEPNFPENLLYIPFLRGPPV